MQRLALSDVADRHPFVAVPRVPAAPSWSTSVHARRGDIWETKGCQKRTRVPFRQPTISPCSRGDRIAIYPSSYVTGPCGSVSPTTSWSGERAARLQADKARDEEVCAHRIRPRIPKGWSYFLAPHHLHRLTIPIEGTVIGVDDAHHRRCVSEVR